MGRVGAQVGRMIVIGSARWWWPGGGTSSELVDRVPSFSAPTAGGFMFRRDRARYHEHLEALRIAVARDAPSTLIVEGRLPSRSALARVRAEAAAQPAGWTIRYVDRTGRCSAHVDPRRYVVSRQGAAELLDHLTSVLASPRSAAFAADALSWALREYAVTDRRPASWVDEELSHLS